MSKATNIVWHESTVTRAHREKLLKQKGKILWFTGLSGSGKSTVANAVEKRLHELGKATYMLDGDNIRYGINSDLGFSAEDRKENIRRVGEVAKLFTDAGLIVLSCFISPFREDREAVRLLAPEDFIEIYISTPLEECEKRDPKKLYEKARRGEISDFTGVSSPYEVPDNPKLQVPTHLQTIEQSVEQIIKYILK